MRQIRMPMNLYRTPCSPAYWHEANLAMKCLKLLVFAALMIAVTRALSLIPGIPIWHTKLTWGFLARSVCALVCGPVLGLVFGFVEDTMAGVLVYALFFFRRRITVVKLVLANAVVNLLVNAAMGSVWSTMVRGGGYLGWFIPSLTKNLITILPKAAALYILFQALLPILRRMDLIPDQTEGQIRIF